MSLFLPDISTEGSARRTRRWGILLAIIVVIGGASVPVYRVVKKKRAQSMQQEAADALAKNQWERAFQKLQVAMHLNPGELSTIRMMAHVLTHYGREEAFDYWNRVFSANNYSRSERDEAVELALALDRLDVAEIYLNEDLRRPEVATQTLRFAAALSDKRGDRDKAIAFARATLAREPGDARARFFLARSLAATGSPALQAESRTLLLELAHTPGFAREALESVVELPNLSPAEITSALEDARALTGPPIERDLIEADLQLRRSPTKRSEIAASLAAKYARVTGPELIRFCRWLNGKREYKLATQILSPEVALTDKDLFLVYVDAEAGLGEWSKLETVLAREKLPIDPVYAELYRARVAKVLKKEPAANLHWSQVHFLAAKNPPTLWYVADYAEKSGEPEEALKAYQQLKRNPRTARPAYVALLRMAEARGDLGELRLLVKELTQVFPNDPAPRNDLAYLYLLADENVADSLQTARELVGKYPEVPGYRITLSLGFLRSKNAPAALEILNVLNFDWAHSLPGWQAVYAAALGANGGIAQARELARTIPLDRLKEPERALMQPYLGK